MIRDGTNMGEIDGGK